MKESIKAILPYLLMFVMFLWIMKERRAGSDVTTTNTSVVTYDTVPPPERVINLQIDPIKGQGIDQGTLQDFLDGVYVDRQETEYLREHIEYLKRSIDSLKKPVTVYKDSMSDDNITIYSSDLVEGRLLNKDLKYKLKVPLIITKTIENTTETKVGGLFLTSGLGGNQNAFDNVNLGLQYVAKKDYLVGYNFNLLRKTHNIQVGFKLFRNK